MTTREQAIEIAAKAAWREYQRRFPRSSFSWEECGERTQDSRRRMATAVYDALLAAGVIPAEGMVCIRAPEDGEYIVYRSQCVEPPPLAFDPDDYPITFTPSDTHTRAGLVPSGDLDAIPDAPTGEGER